MRNSLRLLGMACLCCLILAGCSRFAPAGPEPAAETAEETFVPVPTFTPTPAAQAAAQSTSAESTAIDPSTAVTASSATSGGAQSESSLEAGDDTAAASALDTLLPTATTGEAAVQQPAGENQDVAEDEPAGSRASEGPRLTVSGESVNVRGGPDTTYAVVGAANGGQEYEVTGRNEAGDWWQVCCFEGGPGWLYAPLVEVQNGEAVAVATDIPAAPAAADAEPAPAEIAAPVETTVPAEEPAPEALAPAPIADSGTGGSFDPAAQYHIVGYRVIGYGENNGGLFNNGAQHMIFVNVLDADGNGIDGAVVKNAINDNIEIVTGTKGPGRAEFEMFWDPYKLYVVSDPSGPVTSQISNQMNTAYPHIPDVVGKLGPPEEEYAICPTLDDRCEPPFFHAHWSYEITFQKVN